MKYIVEYYSWNDGHDVNRSSFDTKEEAEDFVFSYWTCPDFYDSDYKEAYCNLFECKKLDVSSILENTRAYNEGKERGIRFARMEEIERRRQGKRDSDYQHYLELKERFEK